MTEEGKRSLVFDTSAMLKVLNREQGHEKITALLRSYKGACVASALSVHEIGRTGLTDQEQLEYASSEGRCFVTRNRNDYIILTRQFFSNGSSHKGVLIVSSTYKLNDFKGIADAIFEYASGWGKNPTDYLFDFI